MLGAGHVLLASGCSSYDDIASLYLIVGEFIQGWWEWSNKLQTWVESSLEWVDSLGYRCVCAMSLPLP